MKDKKKVFGRTNEILSAVKTLADPLSMINVLIIKGKEGSYHQYVAKFAVKYVMDR